MVTRAAMDFVDIGRRDIVALFYQRCGKLQPLAVLRYEDTIFRDDMMRWIMAIRLLVACWFKCCARCQGTMCNEDLVVAGPL